MDTFDAHRADWRAYTSTPWGRIRYAVVRQLLTAHLGRVAEGATPLRVLDVGGADGLDARAVADLGHDVTVLDPAPELLADAGASGLHTELGGLDDLPGREPVDAVLCHYVLQYRPADRLLPDLRLLAGAVRPGGLVSVVLPNPDHRVLTAFLREGPGAALAELGSGTARTETFGTDMRKIALPDLLEAMARAGLEVVEVVGGRVVGDLMLDNAAKEDPGFYADWERLELALSRREPYNRLGQLYGVVARRP